MKKLSSTTLLTFSLSIAGLLILYLLINTNSLKFDTAISQEAGKISFVTIFLTGLLTGGLTCLAVQGGLLATTISKQHEDNLKNKLTKSGNAIPILTFLGSKLVAYTILGALLGWFGSLFDLSITTQVIMQFAVAIFMIGMAMNMLNVHPIFRYFVIQPPKSVARMLRNTSKRGDLFAPLLLGAFTVFIPCGITQAMMALAIASGNPALGAAILFTFILGTSPLFFVLGYFAAKLGETFQTKFTKVAAGVLILLALYNINGALALSGSPIGFGSPKSGSNGQANESVLGNAQTSDENTIEFLQSSYSPETITVKAGSNVKLKLKNTSGGGCIQAFTIPKLGIKKIVRIGTTETLEFTAPSKPTTIPFMCSMGMFRGEIEVI
jgi:sulfite exporter TauE/SafE